MFWRGGLSTEVTDRMRTAVREGRLEDAMSEETREYFDSLRV